LEGFNGAGLYESKSIAMKDCFNPEKIARTLKYVWASLWNWRGFQERKLFGIKEDNVHMAVLVQPFFGKKSVYCNGVAITANPFRNDFSGMLMNVQVGTKCVIHDSPMD
jgi:phosphoenolpyruvate synthase/pyruvate phosphate dikinase